jgi:hypothetical protein
MLDCDERVDLHDMTLMVVIRMYTIHAHNYG